MKKIFLTLVAMLGFGIASAQYNNVEPSTAASPAPGMPVIEKSTEKEIKGQARNGSSTQLITAPPVYSTQTQSAAPPQSQPLMPVNPVTNPNNYPGATTAYPKAQGNIEPGTGTSTTQPVSGSNNPTTTLPASTTSNQGKLP